VILSELRFRVNGRPQSWRIIDVVEPTITCKNCGALNPLTETLARPYLEAERRKIEKEVEERAAFFDRREKELQRRAEEVEAANSAAQEKIAQIEMTVQHRLSEERNAITAVALRKAEVEFKTQLDAARNENERQSEKIAQLEKAELEFRTKSAALEEEKRTLDLAVARKVDDERQRIRIEAIGELTEVHERELKAKDETLTELNAKVEEAQKAELAVRQERQRVEAEKKEIELAVARQIDEERHRIRQSTQKEDDERYRFNLAEKDKVIEDMRRQIDDLRRKSEQGSQQIQGEVQEVALETVLRMAFPKDQIDPVPNGRSGSDVLQRVVGLNGLVCGTILWESKRTKNWSDGWLAKNRDDQRAVDAHIGVIVTATLPNDIDAFDRKDGVWVVGFAHVAALGRTLRQLLIEAALAKVSGEDRQGKSNRVYSYVTGQAFRQRVGAIVDAYITLRQEIETEKRTHKTRWARQERSLELLLDGAGRLYGDLQGIVGKSMPEIEGLEAPQLSSSDATEAASGSLTATTK
jgi:hypothetical protein